MASGDTFDQDMQGLESELKRLETEYSQFFAGRTPKAPFEMRSRVDTLFKRFSRVEYRNTAQRFRFSTIYAKYVSYCELWERALKAKEEGRPVRTARLGGGEAPRSRPAAAPVSRAPAPPESIRNPHTQPDRLRQLYDELSQARQRAGEPPLAYDRFAQVVKAQTTKLGQGQRDVEFRVEERDGKVTLKATTAEKLK